MRWEKLGRVAVPDAESKWARSHAYLPTPYLLDAERIRVYVAFLDADRVGRVGYVDVAVDDPRRVLDVSPRPALDVGEPGSFDDRGVTPSCVVQAGDEVRLYYFGWHLERSVPYVLFSGFASSTDRGMTFVRTSAEPILGPLPGESVCRSAPYVLTEGRWRAWYVSGDEWIEVDGKRVPTYAIRETRSADGVSWSRGTQAIGLRGDEFGLGRPYVRRTAGGYEMWYGRRTRRVGYRIGYATSPDGVEWSRRDTEAGIDVSADGWDSEMVAFAAVQETPRGTYLFYNGNGYGESGFGVAAEVKA